MDISYEVVLALYKEFFTEELKLQEITNGLKVLAIAFFLLNVYSSFFSRMTDKFGATKLPFDEQKLFSSVAMVLAIIFYDKLLDFLDTLLLGVDQTYSHFSPTDFSPPEKEIEEQEDPGAMGMLKLFAAEALHAFTDPTYIFLKLLEGFAWIIDTAIYGVFLLERFFFIGLLKVLGGIAIVLAVFEKFRDLFYKWVKLYVSIYLLILPFFLILGFSAFVTDYFKKNIDVPLFESQIHIVVLTIMIWLKLRLFKKSYDIVYKVFT
ncbi:hypothetical protein HME9304_01793 [Flagellimonas maritima]|uniref:Conjugal transfer protein TrbL n=1 Tax=Flagellimonas maritima TaxID=1383885 RepID=A0A2Z4LTU6_9FLAO|nr:hypothetical protein [Allomuricauda aurantiaca]AWX44788.1 hypothetical protein HME9304_01793 [Allomuricauda aurantiaca]